MRTSTTAGRRRRSGPPAAGRGDPGPLTGVFPPLLVLLLAVGVSPLVGDASRAAATSPAVPVPLLHTELESSSPAPGAERAEPVTRIRLRFTTAVQPELSTIEVAGESGPVQPMGPPEAVPDTERRELRVRFAEGLGPGSYRVSWRTAGPDGHPVQGEFEFRVAGGDGAAAPDEAAGTGPSPQEAGEQRETATPEVPEPAGEEAARGADAPGAAAAETAIRWLFYLSIVAMLGAVAFRLLVLPQVTRHPDVEGAMAAAARGGWVLAWIAAGLGLLALPARLWDQSVGLFGADALAGENLGALLFGTAWGGGWLLHAAFLGLFLLGAAWAAPAGRRRRGWLVMGAAAAGMAVVPGLQGHAWNADGRELALLNHSLHVLAVGTWMGGLGTMLLAGLPALRRLSPRDAEAPGAADEAPRPDRQPAGAGGEGPGPAGGPGRAAAPPDNFSDEGAGPTHEPQPPTGGSPPRGTGTDDPASGAPPPLLATMVDGFSRVALGAVTLLVGTGVINAWIHLNEVTELFSTGYGRMLLIKVGIAMGAVALGFYNWQNVRPSLHETPRPGLIRIPATLEFLLGLGVLLATALLVAQGVPA